MKTKYNQPTVEELTQKDSENPLIPIPRDGYLIQQINTPLEEDIQADKPAPVMLYIVRAEMISYYNMYKKHLNYQVHDIYHHFWRRYGDHGFRKGVQREQEVLTELMDQTEKSLKKEQQYAQRCASVFLILFFHFVWYYLIFFLLFSIIKMKKINIYN